MSTAGVVNGYAGLFKQPIIDTKNNLEPTLFCSINSSTHTLVLVIISPECYNLAYRIATDSRYEDIVIIPTSLDALFLSTVFNLVMSLRKIKPVKWIYPDRLHFPTSVEFINSQTVSNTFMFQGEAEGLVFDTNFSLIKSDAPNRTLPVYDIVIQDMMKTRYFMQYCNLEKIEKVIKECGEKTEIHMAYSSTLYGGSVYKDISNVTMKYFNNIRVHSFVHLEEYLFCTENNRILTGEVRYNDFI